MVVDVEDDIVDEPCEVDTELDAVEEGPSQRRLQSV